LSRLTSSIMFGWAELTDVFVTMAAQAGLMRVMAPGPEAISCRIGSQLYRCNLGIQDKPEHPVEVS